MSIGGWLNTGIWVPLCLCEGVEARRHVLGPRMEAAPQFWGLTVGTPLPREDVSAMESRH